jgi:hypothetical protein
VVSDDWSVSVVGNWGWSVSLDDWNWVSVDWGGLVDDGVESVVVIGGVVNGSDWTVRFDEGVLSLDDISVALFVLWLDVSGVWVLDAVVESVFRVGNWLWDDDFVDGSVSNIGWSVVVGWQWSVDRAGSHWDDEESSDNEALRMREKTELITSLH